MLFLFKGPFGNFAQKKLVTTITEFLSLFATVKINIYFQ